MQGLFIHSLGLSPSWEKGGPVINCMRMRLIKPSLRMSHKPPTWQISLLQNQQPELRIAVFSLRGCGMIQELPRRTSVMSESYKIGTS